MVSTPRLRLVVLALSTACAVAACGACAGRAGATAQGGQPPPKGAPQLLDPLTAGEKATAEKLVRADGRAKDLLGPEATLVSIELLAMKDTGRDEPVRHADLLFSRPDTDFGARAIVNLSATPAIVEFTRVDRRSVPTTDADIQEAWRIALADTAYRTRLARDPSGLKQEALRIYTEDPNDPCFTGRCFYLIAKQGDFYVPTASATVDLTTRRILPERSPK